MTAPLKVFFSYAHADEAHRETLANHLSALENEGLITIWHDRKMGFSAYRPETHQSRICS
jgi:DNA-binding transcriptional ArsR family regulator